MIYEFRISTLNPGKMDVLHSRIREHTGALFDKHGFRSVGYWTNSIGGPSNELIYLTGFNDLAHREEAWASFYADPIWEQARSATEEDGPLLHHLDNRILVPTDYSPLQ